MSLKIYEYKNCSTCKNALKYLGEKKITYTALPIVDEPPTIAELQKMLTHLKSRGGSFKNLFNTSGIQYRELGLAEKIKNGLDEKEAIDLLSKNGKLIKRPFLISDKIGLVGFKKDEWDSLLKK